MANNAGKVEYDPFPNQSQKKKNQSGEKFKMYKGFYIFFEIFFLEVWTRQFPMQKKNPCVLLIKTFCAHWLEFDIFGRIGL